MIYIGAGDGIYRWSPGASWPVFHALEQRSIAQLASPGSGRWAVVDEEGQVLESRDNGLSWRTIPTPGEGVGRPAALAVGGPGLIVLAVRPSALFYRSFGSASAWTRLPDPPIPQSKSGSNIRLISSPSAETKVWYVSVSKFGLLRSDDACATWTKCENVPEDVYAIRTCRLDKGGELVVAATSAGVWASEDAGATWSERNNGLGSSLHVRAVEIEPGNPDYWLAGAAPAKSSEPSPVGKPAIMGFASTSRRIAASPGCTSAEGFRRCSNSSRSTTFASTPNRRNMR